MDAPPERSDIERSTDDLHPHSYGGPLAGRSENASQSIIIDARALSGVKKHHNVC